MQTPSTEVRHLSMEELEAGLDHIRQSPKDNGILKMIVRRPDTLQREVLEEGTIDLTEGLLGDNWSRRPSSRTPDKSPHPDMQLNIMNARAIALLAQTEDRWQLAGDQLLVDMELSDENLPAGTQLSIGSAIIEVTTQPHNGCKKFAQRFGIDAVKFVNSPIGKELHLRGINAKVIQGGTIRKGDVVRKLLNG
ncbi:MAG: MOSC domain-containing protein [Chitinophagales bacterium]